MAVRGLRNEADVSTDAPAPSADPGARVEGLARDGDFAAVATVLRARRDDVLRSWLEVVKAQPFLRGEGERAAADHIPELYDALVALLERCAPRTRAAQPPLDDAGLLSEAEAHARERLEQGLSAADVVTEFRLLRQEIGRELRSALSSKAAHPRCASAHATSRHRGRGARGA